MQILGYSLRVQNLDGYLEVLYSVGNKAKEKADHSEKTRHEASLWCSRSKILEAAFTWDWSVSRPSVHLGN